MVRHSNKSTEVSRVLICRNYGSVMNEAMVQMKLGDEIETWWCKPAICSDYEVQRNEWVGVGVSKMWYTHSRKAQQALLRPRKSNEPPPWAWMIEPLRSCAMMNGKPSSTLELLRPIALQWVAKGEEFEAGHACSLGPSQTFFWRFQYWSWKFSYRWNGLNVRKIDGGAQKRVGGIGGRFVGLSEDAEGNLRNRWRRHLGLRRRWWRASRSEGYCTLVGRRGERTDDRLWKRLSTRRRYMIHCWANALWLAMKVWPSWRKKFARPNSK